MADKDADEEWDKDALYEIAMAAVVVLSLLAAK